MRDHLDGFAQVVTTALFLENAFVNLTGREVVGLLHARFNETLIVAEVEVGLRPIVGHVHLTMLKR